MVSRLVFVIVVSLFKQSFIYLFKDPYGLPLYLLPTDPVFPKFRIYIFFKLESLFIVFSTPPDSNYSSISDSSY